jgi:hypothetical protein
MLSDSFAVGGVGSIAFWRTDKVFNGRTCVLGQSAYGSSLLALCMVGHLVVSPSWTIRGVLAVSITSFRVAYYHDDLTLQ